MKFVTNHLSEPLHKREIERATVFYEWIINTTTTNNCNINTNKQTKNYLPSVLYLKRIKNEMKKASLIKFNGFKVKTKTKQKNKIKTNKKKMKQEPQQIKIYVNMNLSKEYEMRNLCIF